MSTMRSPIARIGRRRAVGLLGALIAGVALSGSAQAAGGPGTPRPVTFTPGSFGLDAPTGQVTMTGTVSCTMPAEAHFFGSLVELVGKDVSTSPFNPDATGKEIVASDAVLVACPVPGSYPMELTFASDAQRGFRPGPVQLYLEMQYDTVPDPVTGIHYPGSAFGVIPADLHPGH